MRMGSCLADGSGAAPVARQVTILGLGLFGGGVGAARYFAERGARVIVTDLRDASALAESLEALRDLDIHYRLGGHSPGDFAGSDLVVVNPAVPPSAPALEMARAASARLTTEINLLFDLSPAPILAVTGTHGKSTTTALLAEILRQSGKKVWVGGNLGGSLLSETDVMRPEDIVVIEISSFQCERLAWIRRSPHGAAVLNLTPNHLDRHADMREYAAAKQELLRYQMARDFALLNGEDPIVREWGQIGMGHKIFYGAPFEASCGARLENDRVLVWRDGSRAAFSLASLRLPGTHNRFNAACAGTMAWWMGCDPDVIERAIGHFAGLPDRLELILERDGIRFYNDSLATTPESAIAALEAVSPPVVLIAGGSSKRHSFDGFAATIVKRCKAVCLVGDTAPEIAGALAKHPGPPPFRIFDRFDEAVREAARIAAPGDTVLLSPACASFDRFRNYRERGRAFAQIVRALSADGPPRSGLVGGSPPTARASTMKGPL